MELLFVLIIWRLKYMGVFGGGGGPLYPKDKLFININILTTVIANLVLKFLCRVKTKNLCVTDTENSFMQK